MKKLLITLLVFGMALAANALPILNIIADEDEPIARITGYLEMDV